ncbi:MAG: hypothetical protein D6790_20345 [Caldilineae bacterium]|nr:MAG: hypothetical protein D6790_20345 [Caldilineae bacterium]
MNVAAKFAGTFLYRDKATGKPSSTGIEFRTMDGKYVKLYLPFSNADVANAKLDKASKALKAKRKPGLPLYQDLYVVLATSEVLKEDPNTLFDLECDTLRNGDLTVKSITVSTGDNEAAPTTFDDIF